MTGNNAGIAVRVEREPVGAAVIGSRCTKPGRVSYSVGHYGAVGVAGRSGAECVVLVPVPV